MILIALKDKSFAKRLKEDLYAPGVEVKLLNVGDRSLMGELYNENVQALVTDDEFKHFPKEAMSHILMGLAQKIPVLVLTDSERMTEESANHIWIGNPFVTVIDREQYNEVVTMAKLFRKLKEGEGVREQCKSIPYYNAHVSESMLKTYGGLGVLTIDATSFNKISVEYGADVYRRVIEVLHDVLFELWGEEGNFRENDIICRRTTNTNIFVVLMSRSRETGSLPYPGVLEKVADRLSQAIHNSLWDELFLSREKRRIPQCLESLPLIGVGFYGILNNPCFDPQNLLDSGLEASQQMAKSQMKRSRERQRELMHTLIQSPDILHPHYQGVFDLQGLDKELIDTVKESGSISVIRDKIYGFESLIRINQEAAKADKIFDNGIEARYLRPDVLFSLAKSTKVALELDQACMRHAARCSEELPGHLMINILPRNLYYINALKASFLRSDRLMFEISESEAINNIELMMKARQSLEKENIRIAADDFGKGYSSLERVIKIKPDVIKFDRGIIQDVDHDSVKQAYVKGLVQAAKILNTTILAEGVETWAEAETLKDMGVELIQGFLIHRPQAVEDILKQLQEDDKKALNTVA